MAIRRLQKELQYFNQESHPNIFASPTKDEDLFNWTAVIIGPEDTPYAGGAFELNVQFPNDYPFKPPRCRFVTKIYHPNISSTGAICLDILQSSWSPALSITKVLMSICARLTDPNVDDYLMPEAAKLYKTDRAKFNQTAKNWTQNYAK